jgi:hypothetical protein
VSAGAGGGYRPVCGQAGDENSFPAFRIQVNALAWIFLPASEG